MTGDEVLNKKIVWRVAEISWTAKILVPWHHYIHVETEPCKAICFAGIQT